MASMAATEGASSSRFQSPEDFCGDPDAAAHNQRKNAEIQSLKSRSLVSQAAKMIAVARQLCLQIKRVPVTAANGNQEAQAYALEFVNVFRNAPPCASDLALPIPGLRPDVQGIKVGVRDIVNIPPEVHLIEQVPHAGDI